MATPASEIIARAREDLNDADGVRWPGLTMLKHLNEAQALIVILKPSANAVTALAPLAAGTRQALPAGAVVMVRPTRNVKADGTFERVPRLVTPEVLDGLLPGWHAATPAKTVRYVAYDPAADPKQFWVYPPQPADTDQKLEMIHSALPEAIPNVNANVSLADEYVPALVDYLVHRCFAKDSEVPESLGRSQAALQGFATKLGVAMPAVRQAQQQQRGAAQ